MDLRTDSIEINGVMLFESRDKTLGLPDTIPTNLITYSVIFGIPDSSQNENGINTRYLEGKNLDSLNKIVDSIKSVLAPDTLSFVKYSCIYPVWRAEFSYIWEKNLDTIKFLIDTINTKAKDSVLPSMFPLANDRSHGELPPWLSDCNSAQAKGGFFSWKDTYKDHSVDIQYYQKGIGAIYQHFEMLSFRNSNYRIIDSRLISFNDKDIPDYSKIYPITFPSGYVDIGTTLTGPVCFQTPQSIKYGRSPPVPHKEAKYVSFDLRGRAIPVSNIKRVPPGLGIVKNLSTVSLKIDCHIKR